MNKIEELMMTLASRKADAFKRWAEADYLCDEKHAAWWSAKSATYEEILQELEKITGKKEIDLWRKKKNEELQQERN